MALRGSLNDLGLAELMQLPGMSNRTGRLRVERGDQKARLYYVDGQITHATLGTLEGFGVLVEVLGWTQGKFEFEVGITAEQRTIEMELHKALMQAMFQSDERAGGADGDAEAQHIKSTAGFGSVFGPTADPGIFAQVSTFLAEHPVIFYVCVISLQGEVKAEIIKPTDQVGEHADSIVLLRDIMKNYANECPELMIVESSYCTAGITTVAGHAVIALAQSDVSRARLEASLQELAARL